MFVPTLPCVPGMRLYVALEHCTTLIVLAHVYVVLSLSWIERMLVELRCSKCGAESVCRGRDSNPHSPFGKEDFKSFNYSKKAFDLLVLFPSNVKVCKFLCKC